MIATERRTLTRADVTVRRVAPGAVVVLKSNGQQLGEIHRRDEPGSHTPHNWGVPAESGTMRWFHHRIDAVAWLCDRYVLVEATP